MYILVSSVFTDKMDMWVVLTVLAGVVVGYLLWAAADRWVLHKGRKGPVQWPILGMYSSSSSITRISHL